MTFDASLFWPAFRDAGLLVEAAIGTTTIDVGFTRPDQLRLDGITRSTEYQIEYLAADAPDLAEGDDVTIGADAYRVRETPRVSDEPGADGTWRIATLTKV